MLEDNKTDANGNGVPDLCERKQENSRGNVSGNEYSEQDWTSLKVRIGWEKGSLK